MSVADQLSVRRRQLRLMSLAALTLLYMLILAVAGIILWQLITHDQGQHILSWAIAGFATAIAVPASFHLAYMHGLYYDSPRLQRYVVRIILLLPLMAITSWLSLRFHHAAVYMELAVKFYEAYVIYSFFQLLVQFLSGGDLVALSAMIVKAKGPTINWMFPFCRYRMSSHKFLFRTWLGVYQYVAVQMITAVIALVTELTGYYCEGEFDLSCAYIYVSFLMNASQTIALYCLAMFYVQLKKQLKPLHPESKFLAVKAIVFLTFWQSMAIGLLSYFDVIGSSGDSSQQILGNEIQDFAICIECAVLSIWHVFVFNYKSFSSGGNLASIAVVAAAEVAQGPVGAEGLASPLLLDGDDGDADADKQLLQYLSGSAADKTGGYKQPGGGPDDSESLGASVELSHPPPLLDSALYGSTRSFAIASPGYSSKSVRGQGFLFAMAHAIKPTDIVLDVKRHVEARTPASRAANRAGSTNHAGGSPDGPAAGASPDNTR